MGVQIIKLKRGLRANLPTVAGLGIVDGEPFFCVDTGELFIWSDTTHQMMPIGSTAPVNALGLGGFLSAGRLNVTGGELSTNNSFIAVNGVINQVLAWQFVLPVAFKLGRCTAPTFGVAGGPGSLAAFAIYDKNKNLVCQATGFDGTNVSTPQSKTFTQVTLPPGVYYFAQTANDAAIKINSFQGNSIRQFLGSLAPSGYNRIGIAANSFSAGSFPASLGSLDGSNPQGGAVVFWEA